MWLLRISAATAIAKLETAKARKKQKEQYEIATVIAKATGLCYWKPLHAERRGLGRCYKEMRDSYGAKI
jgi:hypothetical protein